MRVWKWNGTPNPSTSRPSARCECCADDLAERSTRWSRSRRSAACTRATTAGSRPDVDTTAAEMTDVDRSTPRLAARLLAGDIDKEVRGQGIVSFSQSVSPGTPSD